jgi:transposase-like protein
MNTIHLPPVRRQSRTTVSQRQRLVAAFDRSGLSAAAFARQHQIAYSTFCQWRSKRRRRPHPTFAEVEILRPAAPAPVVIELSPHARMRLESPDQVELAAALLKHLQTPC